MILYEKDPRTGKKTRVVVNWSDRSSLCHKCGKVDVTKPATFVNACALGSPLLMEKAVEIQAPVEKEKKKQVREWAKKMGVFKL
jgi:hypothetical protein